MKKNTTFAIYIWVTLLLAASALPGCKASPPSIVPSPQPINTVPLYTHYTPPGKLNIHLEFDYPSYWVLRDATGNTDISIVSLLDPQSNTLQTPLSSDDYFPPDDFGNVSIIVKPVEPNQTPHTEVELLKQSYSEHSWMTVLDDYKIKIDGYDASVLEYQTDDPESSPSLMFNRRVFFIVKDQMHEIYFTVAEKDRGGEFEKGYEYFFNSLKIVP